MSNKPLNDAIEQVTGMIRGLAGERPCLPSTELFNEGWMLRLILHAAESEEIGEYIPQITLPSQWRSEVRLYTPFNEARGTAREGLTKADGVVGDFTWSDDTTTGLTLHAEPKRFEVFEAKMYSKLSKGVKAAAWFDQAVRNVACMAHACALKGVKPDELKRIGFRIVAPNRQIEQGIFSLEMTPASMRAKARRRIGQFNDQGREELELWYDEYFDPLLMRFEDEGSLRRPISWEDLIANIPDDAWRESIEAFYKRCNDEAGASQPVAGTQRPIKGGRYQIVGASQSEVVVVCCAGDKSSRVFIPGSNRESFRIENRRLGPVPGGASPECLPIPNIGESRTHNGRVVCIVSPGPCRSKVEDPVVPGCVTLVDNHLLRPTDEQNR